MRQAITTRPAGLASAITWDLGKRTGLPRQLHHRHRHPACFSQRTSPGSALEREHQRLLHQKVLVAAHPGLARKEHSLGRGWGCCAPYRTHIWSSSGPA
jgi:hypothetical protein